MNDLFTQLAAIADAFFKTPSGIALQGLFAGAFLVFLLGLFAALRDGTFDLKYIDAFVRSTIWGRIAPVAGALLVGYISDNQVIQLGAIAAAGVVAAGMIGSALDSLRQIGQPPEKSAALNPVPKD